MKMVHVNANVLTLIELNASAERIRIYVIRGLMHLVQISFAISFFGGAHEPKSQTHTIKRLQCHVYIYIFI